jgi:isocitrate dehydrogenase (NAD+)
MIQTEAIEKAKEHFAKLLVEQLLRVDQIKAGEDWVDYSKLHPLIIGVVGGDGIGPYITEQAVRVLSYVLADEIAEGKVELRDIPGLDIESRVKVMKALPEDVLAALKECHVILKGPLTTPKKGDKWPNLESANVSMRRELDLFANVRPVKVP